jgi:hypothetical protein
MERRQFVTLAMTAVVLAGGSAALAAPPTTWENLVQVKSKKFGLVYLAPGADFRAYTKVMLDPTEVAFHKDWAKDYNRDKRGVSGRVSDSDIQKAVAGGGSTATDIFTKAFTDGGYAVVTTPGPDVLRVRTALINIRVSAPDIPQAGRTQSFAGEAGEATLVVEVRDSVTSDLLGRAVDRQWAGDNSSAMRNRVTNRADFRILAKSWAKASVNGVAELKRLSPVQATAAN